VCSEIIRGLGHDSSHKYKLSFIVIVVLQTIFIKDDKNNKGQLVLVCANPFLIVSWHPAFAFTVLSV